MSRPTAPRAQRRAASLAFLWLGAFGCAGAERSPVVDSSLVEIRPAGAPVLAPAPALSTVEAIKARVDSIDEYCERYPERLKVYAAVSGSQALVPVKDSTDWPDDVEASINVVEDSAGRVLVHREMPTSGSGDWFAVSSHYFAPDGRTIYYQFEISGFSGGCTDILRETKGLYFNPSFAVLKEERRFADKDGKAIENTDECFRRSDSAPEPVREVSQLRVR